MKKLTLKEGESKCQQTFLFCITVIKAVSFLFSFYLLLTLKYSMEKRGGYLPWFHYCVNVEAKVKPHTMNPPKAPHQLQTGYLLG